MTDFHEDFAAAVDAVNKLFESHVVEYRKVESKLHDKIEDIEVLRQERDDAVETARRLRLELRAIKEPNDASF